MLGITATFVVPALNETLRRGKTFGYVHNVTSLFFQARQEAIRRGVTVVVQPDFANDRLFAFANVDEDPGLQYAPGGGLTRTVDYVVAERPLPKINANRNALDFWGPEDAAPEQAGALDGMTVDGDGNRVVVLQPDGAVRDVGGIRLGDGRGNFFEIRIAPAASARIELLKYHPAPDYGPKGFYPQGLDPGSGKQMWEWFNDPVL